MEFSNCTFENVTEICDGKKYIDCTFNNCQLLYAGGELPAFLRCNLHNTGFIFSGAAGNTLQLLQHMYKGGFELVVDDLIKIIKSPPAAPIGGENG